MSTSDSDYSIDWLASDEDDYDRFSPQLADEPPLLPASSSSSSSAATSCRESPTSCVHSGARRRRSYCRDEGRCRGGVDSDVSPAQAFTAVCSQQTLSVEAKHPSSRKRAHGDRFDAQANTENELFLHKCAELQCYVQPLSSILRGLISGRYSQRLSSFQESVAVDRIQRIMGVLQNPNIGARFLSIILKIEEMLRSWFPHIKPSRTQRGAGTPAKKPKLHRGAASPPPSEPAASYSSTQLTWLHTSPTCSVKAAEVTPAAASHLEVTQDNAVSSSTDPGPLRRQRANPPRLHQRPPPFKVRSPCLERLLQAKESIIAPRTAGDGGVLS